MSEAFRDISPEAPELQPIISGLFAEYAARYGDYFSRDAEVELSEWYVPPQGLFIVLEREGEIIATPRRSNVSGRTAVCASRGWRRRWSRSWSDGRCWPGTAIST